MLNDTKSSIDNVVHAEETLVQSKSWILHLCQI